MKKAYAPLFAILLLSACARHSTDSAIAGADWVASAEASAADENSKLAEQIASVQEAQSAVVRQGLELPETSKLEGPVSRPVQAPVPLVIENPLLEERFLFKSPLSRQMVSETILALNPGEEGVAVPLFDALGEQAKDEYVQAAMLSQSGYNTQALEHYYKAVERDPDNLWLKNRAARAALFQNDLPRCRKLAEEVLAADSKNYQAMLILGTLSTVREQRAEARQWYLKVLEVKDKNIEALENLTRMAYDEKDYEKTKEYAARIMQVTGMNLSAILLHAEASALTGDITHAASLYEQLVHYRPMLISRLSDMGIRLLRQGDLDAAKELFRRGVAMQPETDLIRLQWEALLRETDGEEAIVEGYKKLVGERPLDLRIHELYANYLERRDSTEAVVEQRNKMLEIDPRHVPSLLSLGNVELKQGHFEEAKQFFEKALSSGPQQASTFRDIAIVYLNNKDFKRAEELIHEALATDPNDSQNYIAYAALAEQKEDFKNAEAHLKKAIDLSPANEQYLRLLGDFYRNRGRGEEASQVYEQVLAVNPRDAASQIMLGRLYFDLNNSAQLDRLQKSAALIVEDKSTFYTHYGFLAFEYGDWNRARWAFEHALDETPKDMQARRALALTYLHLSEPQLAEETLQRGEKNIGKGDEARREYDQALLHVYTASKQHDKAVGKVTALAQQQPDDFDMQALLIHTLLEAERQTEAGERMNEIIRKFAPTKPVETQRLRAEVYRAAEDYDRAAGVLLPLLDRADEPLEIIFDLAITFGAKKDIKKAEGYYEHLIGELGMDNSDASNADILVNSYNNLAYLYAQENIKLEKAEEYAGKALKILPGADYITDTLGYIYYRQGKFEEAEKYLKKAEKLSLPDPEICEHLGDLYVAMNRKPEAVAYYEKALALDPKKAAHVREKLDAINPAVGAATPAETPKAQ